MHNNYCDLAWHEKIRLLCTKYTYLSHLLYKLASSVKYTLNFTWLSLAETNKVLSISYNLGTNYEILKPSNVVKFYIHIGLISSCWFTIITNQNYSMHYGLGCLLYFLLQQNQNKISFIWIWS